MKIASIAKIPFDILEKEYNKRKSNLTKLEEQRSSALQEMEKINRQIDEINGKKSPAKKSGFEDWRPRAVVGMKILKESVHSTKVHKHGKVVTLKISKGHKKHLSLKSVAFNVLQKAGHSLQLKELANRISKSGYKTTSKSNVFRATICNQLSNDPRFKKAGLGLYTLSGH